MIYAKIDDLIGNTPLLKISPEVTGLKNINLYAKMENMNPFGSVKDRVAKNLLHSGLEDALQHNKTILEASSGNTAKALSSLCGTYGLKFKTITNRIKQPEIRMILQMLGAEIKELPGMSECADPNDPNDYTMITANLAATHPDEYFYTDQYLNKKNLEAHYNGTGKEILEDLKHVDMFFGFLGTCGSSVGSCNYFLDHGQQTKIFGVISEAGTYVPGGRNSNELWEVGFFDKKYYTEILSGTTDNALDGMFTLCRRCGVLCGPTAGMTFYKSVEKLKELDALYEGVTEKPNAVFIVCDGMEAYTSYVSKYRPSIFNGDSQAETVHNVSVEYLGNVKSLSADELEEIIKKDEATVIDVRSAFAYRAGHIPTSINILDEIFAQMIEQGRVFPQNKKIVVVCAVGKISLKYSAFLQKQGYEAYQLSGGFDTWWEERKEIETLISCCSR